MSERPDDDADDHHVAKRIGISPTGGLKFDGWDVLLGGAIAFLVARVFVHDTPVDLFWVAVVLAILWVIAVILSNLGWLPSRRGPS
jgi:hypothetical protein